MKAAHELKFESPGFAKRLRGMLGVDFYRLFHTPMFYIFLTIDAVIPAMIVSMTALPGADGAAADPLYSNTWNIVAAKLRFIS